MAQERVASFADLLGFLAEEKAAYRHDSALQVVQIAARSGPLDSVVFVRWERNVPYAQIIVPVVRDVPAERVAEVEDAVCRLNHILVLPGFAYDFQKKFIYFRTTAARDEDGITAETLKRLIIASVNTARDYVVALQAVVDGQPGAEILAKAG